MYKAGSGKHWCRNGAGLLTILLNRMHINKHGFTTQREKAKRQYKVHAQFRTHAPEPGSRNDDRYNCNNKYFNHSHGLFDIG